MTPRISLGRSFVLAAAWLLLFPSPARPQKFEFVYVASHAADESGRVSVINPATNKLTATIPVGVFPWAITVTSDGRFAYVANSGLTSSGDSFIPGNVSVVDTAANAVIGTVPVDRVPIGVAITPDGASAYVAHASANTVWVIDTATRVPTATIDTHTTTPSRVAVTPDGTSVYVTNQGSDNVIIVDAATNSVTRTIPVRRCPYGIAITPDGAFAYVANTGHGCPGPGTSINVEAGSVSVIDTASQTVVATITPGLAFGHPSFLAITPDGTSAWVTNCGPGVCVIDTATNAVTAAFATTNTYNLGIAFTKDGKSAYTSCYGTTSAACVIDTTTRAVTATIPLGGAPTDIAVASVRTLDHFKCYKAKTASGTPKFQQRTAMLADEFESKNTTVLKPLSICNPVSVNGERILDSTAHLECYKISPVRGQPRFTRHNVSIDNQFGAETLTATKAATLCVPSETDGKPSVLNLDRFKCYTAKTARGTAKFQQRAVSLADEFESKNTTVVKPVSVCTPVDVNGEDIQDPRPHLECYQIKDVSGQVPFTAKNVAVENKFGSETLTGQRADTLCMVASE